MLWRCPFTLAFECPFVNPICFFPQVKVTLYIVWGPKAAGRSWSFVLIWWVTGSDKIYPVCWYCRSNGWGWGIDSYFYQVTRSFDGVTFMVLYSVSILWWVLDVFIYYLSVSFFFLSLLSLLIGPCLNWSHIYVGIVDVIVILHMSFTNARRYSEYSSKIYLILNHIENYLWRPSSKQIRSHALSFWHTQIQYKYKTVTFAVLKRLSSNSCLSICDSIQKTLCLYRIVDAIIIFSCEVLLRFTIIFHRYSCYFANVASYLTLH